MKSYRNERRRMADRLTSSFEGCCTDIQTQSMFEEISISAQHEIRFKEQKNYDPHRVLSFGSPHTTKKKRKSFQSVPLEPHVIGLLFKNSIKMLGPRANKICHVISSHVTHQGVIKQTITDNKEFRTFFFVVVVVAIDCELKYGQFIVQ
ncbi:hypothetical protein CEXT_346921 [Caerostris extrusa]|uniref:Uncharacterized protein n=1 Tax=Caerostris extrusa TaxID=172846 RepID=A0AAV4V941_CAEEX|nr:hypothetical protein CEXT_346921 [Caerostris extrusa]